MQQILQFQKQLLAVSYWLLAPDKRQIVVPREAMHEMSVGEIGGEVGDDCVAIGDFYGDSAVGSADIAAILSKGLPPP